MRAIRGEPGSGKTALVFRELKAALRGGESARLVVPTATLVKHFRHELARDGVVCAPSTVVSLTRFAADAALPLKAPPPGVLRALIREELTRDARSEFAAAAGTEGMVATLAETIGLFENAAALPDQMASVRGLKGYTKAFAKLWTAVAERLHENGFASGPEIMRAAAANTRGLLLWFDGFLAFTPAETQLLRALGETCEVTVTVSGDELWRQTLQWGCRQTNLPGAPRKPAITAVSAPSMEREADEIARRIAESGAYGRIAVAVRDAETYEPLLRGTFERFGIPARFYFARALRRQPAPLFLSGLIDCALDDWEFGATLAALRNNPAWGASGVFDAFDFRVREAMPGRSTEALLELCEDPQLRRRLKDCFSIAGWVLEKRTPSQWCERLQTFAANVYKPGLIDAPRTFADIETLRAESAALRSWAAAVGESVACRPASAPAIGFGDFWRTASEAVAAASVRVNDDRRDVVHVMSVYEARQWDVDTLFVCGMTDREYPKKAQSNIIFPDAAIEVLRRAGLQLRKASDTEADEEALFKTLRGRAGKALILSWPTHDASGKRAESSRFIAQLIEEGSASESTAMLCAPELSVQPPPAGVPGRIIAPDLLDHLAQRHARISITTLEDLAQCRFKFFAGRSVGLKPKPERPQERLGARTMGLILHHALEEWLREGREGGFVPYFEQAFEDMCREEHLPEGYRLEVERIECRRIAEQVSATEKWTTPFPPEVEVPISIPFPGGITVTGRVDRVDLLNERDCIVVDYKSGKTKRVEAFTLSPLKLQGPFYALALRESRGLNTVAMFFHAVRDDKRFGWGEVPGADFELQPIPERWIEDARDRTVERIADFLAGEVRAEPADRSQCRWCDFQAACRVEQRGADTLTEGAAGG